MHALKPSETLTVLERRFAARQSKVFEALTQPTYLFSWLGTAEMALVSCEVDLRAGGTFRYTFRRGARTMEVRGTYESVHAPHRFVYSESYDFSPLQLTVTTELTTASDGTALRQTLQYESRRDRDEDFDGVVSSSAEAFARLDRHFETERGGVSLSLARSIQLAAAPRAVWEVLTRADLVERWLGTRVRSSWRVGEPIVFEFSWEGRTFEDKGVVREVVPEQILAYTYWSGLSGLPDEPHNYSLITFQLTQDDGGTTLALRHEQIASAQMRDHSEKNWDGSLLSIGALAEK
ncbi:MAG: SRPBCC family protein [Gemmatimonadota bacterium]